ncbi:DJ-1/PfpI family protein [Devosia sp. A16]|uniref:DJ-1/PfpI family protein n=1 Tax=Devosia sp. A16 TaxID=1736675 RepID=UPI0006D7DDE9|nr:DJ-1/PfpI family protein [Devosia sp. A16]
MRKRIIFAAIGAIVLAALIATPLLLVPGTPAAAPPPAEPIATDEQAATIAAMRPTRATARPVIAIVTWNQATELSDFFSAYGVLKRADVAEVTVVAEKPEPVQLYPGPKITPETTIADFDAAHPDGADYVVVPAMDPGTDQVIADWLVAQHAKGARIISICNGSRMLGFAGLLDGRRATGHWSAVAELRARHPTMTFVPDRRYVVDDGVATSTGITANIPIMLALVEAIGGRAVAERTAAELGVASWDARHRSSGFELTLEHKKTFIRNALTFWRRETVGIPLEAGVDEVALGLLVDAYARTNLASVVTVNPGGLPVRSRYGLLITPDRSSQTALLDQLLPPPQAEAPAQTLERALPVLAQRYDLPTARIVALVMEYPWAGGAQ